MDSLFWTFASAHIHSKPALPPHCLFLFIFPSIFFLLSSSSHALQRSERPAAHILVDHLSVLFPIPPNVRHIWWNGNEKQEKGLLRKLKENLWHREKQKQLRKGSYLKNREAQVDPKALPLPLHPSLCFFCFPDFT